MATDIDSTAPARPTPVMGLGILVAVTVILGIYIEIASHLGIVPLYAGFLFSLYFGTFRLNALHEWPSAVLGSLAGILVGALLHILPPIWGPAGLYFVLFVIAVAVYAFIMNWAALVVNAAFMLMLTVATIPSVQGDNRFIGMAGAVLLVAVMMGGAGLAGKWLATRKARQTAPAFGQTGLGS